MRVAASIHWYQQGAISMERGAEFSGLSRAEFLAEPARRHVDVFVVDEENVARELRDADTLVVNASPLIFSATRAEAVRLSV